MRGGQVVLRSKITELVEQEFYGMMLAHRAVRTLMNEAALRLNRIMRARAGDAVTQDEFGGN